MSIFFGRTKKAYIIHMLNIIWNMMMMIWRRFGLMYGILDAVAARQMQSDNYYSKNKNKWAVYCYKVRCGIFIHTFSFINFIYVKYLYIYNANQIVVLC